MKIVYSRPLTTPMQEEAIGPWVAPKDFDDLSCVAIHIPVFKISLNVAVGDFDRYKEFMQRQFGQEIKAHAESTRAFFCAFTHEGSDWNWIFLPEMGWFSSDWGTLCHELHHFTHAALQKTGIEYCKEDSEELFAYVQGHSMTLLVRAFIELRKAIRRKRTKREKNLKKK